MWKQLSGEHGDAYDCDDAATVLRSMCGSVGSNACKRCSGGREMHMCDGHDSSVYLYSCDGREGSGAWVHEVGSV